MPEIVLIAALDRQRAIGRDNALPWRLPDDLKRFKALTLGHPLLMGRKTAQSLGRALPGRRNLVLTRSESAPFADMQAVGSLAAALVEVADGPRLCVIGGGQIYALCLPHATALHLTHVDTEVVGADAFFPAFSATDWQIESRIDHPADARHALAFSFIDYRRVVGDQLAAQRRA
jgi:dihydrofolate reductase